MGNTILITEDDRFHLKILSQYFTLLGFEVYTADNCRDTIRLAAQHLPDCFLLDYNLAVETIAPACLFIRSHARLKDTPIVILSGEYEKAEECYNECNADQFLRKCTSLAEVGAAVKRHLRRSRAAAEPGAPADLALDSERLRVLRAGYPDITLSPEQFRFFSLLFRKSPGFVSEKEICAAVLNGECSDESAAVNMLAYRVRQRLGPRLAKRIKNIKRSGWTYVQPRLRSTVQCVPLPEAVLS
ncbi:MAG: response regulator [Elusimicrobiales bacterium]|nr:response regulator [Elusimicrobiales bacterium]